MNCAPDPCNPLFVADGNFLADSVDAAGFRELFRALTAADVGCEALCRFVVPSAAETDPADWLTRRGLVFEPGEEEGCPVFYVDLHGSLVTLSLGPSTRPHAPEQAEQAAFLRLVEQVLAARRPDVVVAHAGPSLSAVLAAARAHGIATVAYQPDCTLRDPSGLHDADVVLTPTRFAADYLREAFGLSCVNLPPVIARHPDPGPAGPASVVFDATGRPGELAVYLQVVEALIRRRARLPLVVLGGAGTVELPGGGSVRCVPREAAAGLWPSAAVLLSPQLGWERTPFTALSALANGVPVISSGRGACAELFGDLCLTLPLPDRVTGAAPLPLTAAELLPWVEAVLRLCDDPPFAAAQRGRAALGGSRWSADRLAPEYTRFLAGLAGRHIRQRLLVHPAPSANGSGAALKRLAEAHAWPAERPEDAAPGQERGWLGAGTELMLTDALTPDTHLVVELGAWLGLSTRFIADHAPAATVLSVDHWAGSPEHNAQERFRHLLPRLYETFQARCWDYRDRIVPLRMKTLEGLEAVAAAGLHPDLVYVDAEHSYEAVSAELDLARRLFPQARLGGDDYDWQGVRRAVDEFARREGLVVRRFGARGWRLLENFDAPSAAGAAPAGRGQAFVLVPYMTHVEWECEQALRQLEQAGVRVVRRGGCSAIDVARNEMASQALHEGAESIFFIDSDVGFDPADALRLLARPEPVVSAVYPKKGVRELASIFADGVKQVLFGPDAVTPYPLRYAATGFLRVRAEVLRRMAAELRLPLCNTHWGAGVWPFFMPLIVPHGQGKAHYLAEDWAFSHRLAQIGVTPLADTTIRLWHWGRYGFGWEDAGSTVHRFRSYSYSLT